MILPLHFESCIRLYPSISEGMVRQHIQYPLDWTRTISCEVHVDTPSLNRSKQSSSSFTTRTEFETAFYPVYPTSDPRFSATRLWGLFGCRMQTVRMEFVSSGGRIFHLSVYMGCVSSLAMTYADMQCHFIITLYRRMGWYILAR